MSTTRAEARDAICQVVKDAAGSYEVVYQDAETKTSARDGKTAYLTVTIKHAETVRQSLAAVGNRRFERTGVVIVQVFTPFGDGFTLADQLATSVQGALEDSAGEVWFRRVSAKEIGKDGSYQQTNVTAAFTYGERR